VGGLHRRFFNLQVQAAHSHPQNGGPHSRAPGHGRGDDCFTGKLPVKRHYKKTVVMLEIPNSFGLS